MTVLKKVGLIWSFYKSFIFLSLIVTICFVVLFWEYHFNIFQILFWIKAVTLGITLRSKTKFVMLDEPFTHLNPLQIEKVKELLLEEKQNKGLLVTDHMFTHIVDISDSLYLLKNGKTLTYFVLR
jgi:hypothetical protein